MIQTISNFLGQFYDLYERGGLPRGDSTGWPSLDPFFTIRRREWTVVTGIPGHGKSSWVDNVIINTARDRDWKWLIFSAENQPAARHASQLSAIYIGRPFRPGPRERMSQEDWLYASAFLDTQVQFIEPRAENCNLDTILRNAETAEIDGLVIDPWNHLNHSRPNGMTETEHIGQSLMRVSQQAKDQNIHVVIVAHPMKLIRQKSTEGDTNVYPVPTPYDISGSAHWRNMADNCICVWRDVLDPRTETQIHVQKIRFREVGMVGLCKLYYDTVTGQFIDPLTGARPVFNVDRYREEMNAKIERHEEELGIIQESQSR